MKVSQYLKINGWKCLNTWKFWHKSSSESNSQSYKLKEHSIISNTHIFELCNKKTECLCNSWPNKCIYLRYQDLWTHHVFPLYPFSIKSLYMFNNMGTHWVLANYQAWSRALAHSRIIHVFLNVLTLHRPQHWNTECINKHLEYV